MPIDPSLPSDRPLTPAPPNAGEKGAATGIKPISQTHIRPGKIQTITILSKKIMRKAPVIGHLAVGVGGLVALGIGLIGVGLSLTATLVTMIALPFIGLAYKANEAYKMRVKDSLFKAVRNMKMMEETSRLKALQKINTANPITASDAGKVARKILTSPKNRDELRRKIADRHIDRFAATHKLDQNTALLLKARTKSLIDKNEPMTREKLYLFMAHMPKKNEDDSYQIGSIILNDTELTEDEQLEIFADLNKFGVEGAELELLADEMSSALSSIGSSDSEIEKECRDYEAHIDALKRALEHPKKNEMLANREITAKLRAALNSRAYQALKYDTDCESVKFLHRIAYGMWTEAQSMDAYQTVGKAMLEKTSQQREAPNEKTSIAVAGQSENAPPSFGSQVAAQFRNTRDIAEEELYTDHGLANKLVYASTHLAQARGSLASQGGKLAKYLARQKYDSHTLSNNPSLQGWTKMRIGDKEARIDNCYGGSPTIGDHEVAPEFLALCQAAENNILQSNLPGKSIDTTLPSFICYTNYQDWNKTGGEGPRSRTIMRLNKQYPLSFQGITLAKDSDFYRMPQHKIEMEKIEWPGAENFGVEMKQVLLDGIEGRGNHEHGMFFPASFDPVIFDRAIERANERFKEKACSGKDAYKLRGAYQEYVYQLVRGQLEIEGANRLIDQGIDNPRVLSQGACKENIDRGGMANMNYMYLHMPQAAGNANELTELLLGVGHSRALAARDRIIIEHRMPQSLYMMEMIDAGNYLDDINAMNADLPRKIGDQTFTPANARQEPSEETIAVSFD